MDPEYSYPISRFVDIDNLLLMYCKHVGMKTVTIQLATKIKDDTAWSGVFKEPFLVFLLYVIGINSGHSVKSSCPSGIIHSILDRREYSPSFSACNCWPKVPFRTYRQTVCTSTAGYDRATPQITSSNRLTSLL